MESLLEGVEVLDYVQMGRFSTLSADPDVRRIDLMSLKNMELIPNDSGCGEGFSERNVPASNTEGDPETLPDLLLPSLVESRPCGPALPRAGSDLLDQSP